MKKLITFIGVLLVSLSSFGQMTINRNITPSSGPYQVGDTLTVKYVIDRGTNPATTPRYVWLRYQYDNKSLLLLPNSTVYGQGTSVQTYSTEWSNYKFTPNPDTPSTSLYGQYLKSPWNFSVNSNWNVGQLSLQRTDAAINGELATQKFIIKDNVSYEDIHNLILAYAIDATSTNISPITTSGNVISLGNVTGGSSSFKVKVAFPTGYTNIIHHNVQLMKLKTDGSGDIDWSQQPIAQLPLDAQGEATFTTQVKIGDSVGVFISPAFQKPFMNDIITVSDAYKAFLAISQVDINGNPTFFTYPNLEKRIGNITLNDNTFNESDAYYLFAYVMGIDVSANAMIPSSTATSIKWQSGLLNQSWLDGNPKHRVLITSNTQTANAVFAWGGDLNWSHSTDPAIVAQNIANNTNITNSIKRTSSIVNINSSMNETNFVGSYQPKQYEKASLSVNSNLENGKVVLTTNLTKSNLAGLEVIMQYDESKLTLDNIIFDSGSTITNFSTNKDGRLTFGSIDQQKTARIKVGTPYKLIFTPKVQLTNTAGLFFFVLSDAVDGNGNKIDLVID